jgi:hypothetical protein
MTEEAERKAARNARLIEHTRSALKTVLGRPDREKLERRVAQVKAASLFELGDIPEEDAATLTYLHRLQAPEREVTAGTSFILDTSALPLPTGLEESGRF